MITRTSSPSRRRTVLAIVLMAASTLVLMAAPQDQVAKPRVVPTVAAAVLQPMLPVLEDWTQDRVRADRVEISDLCSYVFASARYTKGEMTVIVTLADTGFGGEGVMTLASMVVGLPDGYSGKAGPDTTIKRLLFKAAPAAERWDSAAKEGEFVVLLGGRFVAKAEGSHLDNAETLRAVLDQVDLKKLGELK
jgi:hypothetical protein